MRLINYTEGSKIFVLVVISLLILSFPAPASTTSQPVFNPNLEITKTAGEIDIDGVLDDPGWQKAVWTENFVERNPGDNIAPLVKTKVMVTYNEDYLFVGFICYDDPATIRATMCQRDQFYGNDAVIVLLDTYGDATWAYEFHVNPYGVQKDYLWTNIVGEDAGYDIIWNAAAKITETGYQAELAIPFSSIRFPNHDLQNWKMDFWRIHPRESYHQYSWAAYDRNEQCWPCQWGTVNGLSNVHPGKGIEILPSLIANQNGSVTDAYDPDVPFENEDIKGEISLGGKYALNSDVTLEATYNPDYSQIEADAARIDVNTPIALYYSERRPFFQEGQDIFRTLFNSFYTRTIHDPQLAAKLTGRSGPYRFGFVSAVDENTFYIVPKYESSSYANVGKSYVNSFRSLRSFGESSQLGIILNDRRYEAGGYNTVLGLDQRLRLSRNYAVTGQYLVTFTEEPDDTALYKSSSTFNEGKHTYSFDGESFTGYAFISQLRRNARNWNFYIDYNQVGRTYRTETGYDPWVNYRNLSSWTGHTSYFEKGFLERITPQAYIETRWNFEGDRKWTHYNISLDGRIRYAQTYLSLYYSNGDELWADTRFENLWGCGFYVNSRLSDQVGMEFSANRGVDAALNVMKRSNEISLSAGLDLKPIDRLLVEPYFEYLIGNAVDNDEKVYENYVLHTRLRFQATKALSLRLVVEYTYREQLYPVWNGSEYNYVTLKDKYWNIDPLITIQLSPFSIFYIGAAYSYDRLPSDLYPFYASEPDLSLAPVWSLASRHFFMKLQYLFQT